MSKIKKRMLGLVLGMCLFGGSVGSCYAASGSVTVDVTASRVTGKFVYGEAGHQIKVEVYYQEKGPNGFTTTNTISDTQFGNVTTAYVSRNSPSGYQYTWGQAFGFVDGAWAVSSNEVAVN